MDRVFLDACVLFPPLVRGVILGAAGAGLFAPFWSPRVLDEWRIAADRKQGDADRVDAVIARMRESFPGAEVTSDPQVEAAIGLPDPADAHVLAGAIAAGAPTLLTFNLRDFPARTIAAHGIAARHPDGFLWELLSRFPAEMAAPIRAAAASVRAETPQDIRRALKRARLPRLGKAWEAEASSL